MILLFSALLAFADCGLYEPLRDMNCNGVPEEDEGTIDPGMPGCAETEDLLQDHYWGYADLGCQVPLAFADTDGDGRVSGRFYLPDPDPEDDLFPQIVLACDVCPDVADPLQQDLDCDGFGDACDLCPEIRSSNIDADADGIGNECDNCRLVNNPSQRNRDRDQFGDVCDACPDIFDLGQDADEDGVGDACDQCPDDPEHVFMPCAEEGEFRDGLSGSGGCTTAPAAPVLFFLVAAFFRRRRSAG